MGPVDGVPQVAVPEADRVWAALRAKLVQGPRADLVLAPAAEVPGLVDLALAVATDPDPEVVHLVAEAAVSAPSPEWSPLSLLVQAEQARGGAPQRQAKRKSIEFSVP